MEKGESSLVVTHCTARTSVVESKLFWFMKTVQTSEFHDKSGVWSFSVELFQGKAVKLQNEKSQAELLAECCCFLFVQTGNKVWCRVFIPVTALQEGWFELIKLRESLHLVETILLGVT